MAAAEASSEKFYYYLKLKLNHRHRETGFIWRVRYPRSRENVTACVALPCAGRSNAFVALNFFQGSSWSQLSCNVDAAISRTLQIFLENEHFQRRRGVRPDQMWLLYFSGGPLNSLVFLTNPFLTQNNFKPKRRNWGRRDGKLLDRGNAGMCFPKRTRQEKYWSNVRK